MKKIILIVLIAVVATGVSAQQKNTHSTKSSPRKSSRYVEETDVSKHDLYADIGFSMDPSSVGLSVTYNYKLLPWLGAGIGLQDYDFYPTIAHDHQYIPAVYSDFHFVIRPKKKGQVLAFLDIGVNFYGASDRYQRSGNYIDYVPLKNGNYTGLGIGYLRTIKQGRWGLYTTFKMIGNFYGENSYNIATGKKENGRMGEGTFVFSLGFRF